jgi:hypothetical protein
MLCFSDAGERFEEIQSRAHQFVWPRLDNCHFASANFCGALPGKSGAFAGFGSFVGVFAVEIDFRPRRSILEFPQIDKLSENGRGLGCNGWRARDFVVGRLQGDDNYKHDEQDRQTNQDDFHAIRSPNSGVWHCHKNSCSSFNRNENGLRGSGQRSARRGSNSIPFSFL